MPTAFTSLSSGHTVLGEARRSSTPLRLLLLTAALAATVGALAIAVLDRLADASDSPRMAPVATQVPGTAGGRDPSVPDAGGVLSERQALPDEPVATF